MQIKIEKQGVDEATLILPERIDVSNYRVLKKTISAQISEGCTSITLDFTDTIKIDTAGLGCLLSYQKMLKDKGGKLKIINITSVYIEGMFNAINLYKVIDYGEKI